MTEAIDKGIANVERIDRHVEEYKKTILREAEHQLSNQKKQNEVEEEYPMKSPSKEN